MFAIVCCAPTREHRASPHIKKGYCPRVFSLKVKRTPTFSLQSKLLSRANKKPPGLSETSRRLPSGSNLAQNRITPFQLDDNVVIVNVSFIGQSSFLFPNHTTKKPVAKHFKGGVPQSCYRAVHAHKRTRTSNFNPSWLTFFPIKLCALKPRGRRDSNPQPWIDIPSSTN